MLILSRKRNEIIDITTPSGERIEVMVVEIRGDKIRLGFKANVEVVIHRREIQERIEREAGAK